MNQFKIEDLKALETKAYEMRLAVIEMLAGAGSGHTGGALGMADIFTFLYFNYLKHNPTDPDWEGRDYFLLSNGHICPIWYAVLAHTGYFPVEDLKSLRKLGSHLQGHPKNTSTPGVFNSSGPLGHAEGQAIGVALALKQDGKPNRVYCMLSDGGQQEGAVWEAMLVASKYKLDNLTFILDRNGIQIDGTTAQIMPLPNLGEVYSACGWDVWEIDAHSYAQIQAAFIASAPDKGGEKPNLIIANSVPGKGVDFMENKYEWHDWRSPDEQMVAEAKAQLQEKITA